VHSVRVSQPLVYASDELALLIMRIRIPPILGNGISHGAKR